ncbi:MAG: hypothetical protein IJ049_05825 [Oscillospiraceae bacterium]|nr:hypothetical protein [Oscillospiraceae bacterium]
MGNDKDFGKWFRSWIDSYTLDLSTARKILRKILSVLTSNRDESDHSQQNGG